ncbi:MAG: hypothetical protein ACYTFY_10155 [Planctomycetota bacterium]|jgi:hypothetical protein
MVISQITEDIVFLRSALSEGSGFDLDNKTTGKATPAKRLPAAETNNLENAASETNFNITEDSVEINPIFEVEVNQHIEINHTGIDADTQ